MTISSHQYDRASVVARSITRIVEQCREDKAELYARAVDCLRDEFSDIQQQIASDLRIDCKGK
jgi:hypothetical protein